MSNFDSPKSAVGMFDFVGGYLMKEKSGDTELVHCLNRFKVRELTGYEEDIILNESLGMTDRYYSIFGRCLQEVRDDDGHVIIDPAVLLTIPESLVISDVMVLLYRIFQVTMGDELIAKAKCTNEGCGNTQQEFIKLESLKIIPMAGDPKIRVREFKTKKGNVITWEMMTGKMDRTSDREVVRKDSKATAALMRRVRSINGEPVTLEKLKSLGIKERGEIREVFDEEGGIDTTKMTVCRRCGLDFEFNLGMESFSFFRRQGG